jgi:iron complex outermembrane receptor protein
MPKAHATSYAGFASRQLLFFCSVLSGACALATGALAADANAPVAAPESSSNGLQEIVVTATRHEESLSKVPISVTALTQDAMDERGIKDFQDIARFTPGVNIDNSGTNAISIRGISSSAGAGTTGIYIDDTPIQMRSLGFNPDDTLPKTFDLERVEVLRGPQGTLFGAGAEGGAVRYIMTKASTTESETYVRSEVSYTEHGQPSGEFGIAHSEPIVEGVFGLRASVWYRYDGGWINRVNDSTGDVIDKDVNFSNSVAGRITGTWTPTDTLTVTPGILYQQQDKNDDSTYWPAYSDVGAGHFNTATPEKVGGPDTYYLPSLKVQWDLGGSQLISNSSYFSRRQLTAYQGTVYDLSYWQGIPNSVTGIPPEATNPLIDSTGIHLPAALAGTQTPNRMDNTQESITQELRWQSAKSDSAWTWTAGVFWQVAKEGSIEELRSTNINQVFNYLFAETPAAYYAPGGYSCPTRVNYPSIPACDIYYNSNTTFDRQVAGFGEVSYAFTDWARLTIGERVARTLFTLNHFADGLENYGPGGAAADQKQTPNTPKATLSFQVDPKDLYYVTYAKGFRVGGGNAPLPPYCDADLAAAGFPHGAPLNYGSDSTQSYEIGAKNGFGDWLKIASSVYYIKWNQIQQNIYVAGACGLQFTDNLGTAAAWGGDIQVQAKAGPVDIDLALGAQYNFQLASHDAYIRGDWEYEARNHWLAAVQDPNNQATYNNGFSYTLPSTSFFQARAGMNFGIWQIAAFCDNLFDSRTVTNYSLGQSDGTVTPQQNAYTFRPRTAGLTFTLRTH